MDPNSLIHRYLLGEITEAEAQQLDRLLAEDSDLRRQFVVAAATDAELRDVALKRAAESLQTPAHNLTRTKSRWLRPVVWASLAAAVLLAVTIGRLPFRRAPLPTPTTHDDAFLATLVEVGSDVTWSKDHDMPRLSGQGLGKGWIQLDSGAIEIEFRSGAVVRLEGPAMFGIDSCLRGTLEFGGIDVYAPQSASSFTVNTPAMDIVDLGTRFSTRVDEQSGQIDVSVSEGRVDLHVGNPGRNRKIYPLKGGQSASISAGGGILKTTGGAIAGEPDAVGLLAHWSFNSNHGQLASGDLVEDTSPNALHGQILQLPGTEKNEIRTVPGVDSSALDLSDHGAVDLSEHLDAIGALSSFTISAWVRHTKKGMIFSITNESDLQRIRFGRSAGTLFYGWQNRQQWDAVRAVPDESWHPDQWHHVAVTVKGRNVTLYQDGRALIGPCSTGVLLGTPVQSPIDLAEKTRASIGQADRPTPARDTWWTFDAQIDDVQVYDRAIDEESIRYLHSHPGKSLPANSPSP